MLILFYVFRFPRLITPASNIPPPSAQQDRKSILAQRAARFGTIPLHFLSLLFERVWGPVKPNILPVPRSMLFQEIQEIFRNQRTNRAFSKPETRIVAGYFSCAKKDIEESSLSFASYSFLVPSHFVRIDLRLRKTSNEPLTTGEHASPMPEKK